MQFTQAFNEVRARDVFVCRADLLDALLDALLGGHPLKRGADRAENGRLQKAVGAQSCRADG